MAELRVPERYRGGLIKLLNLPDDSVKKLINAVEGVQPKLFADDLSMELISKVKGVSHDDIAAIIDALISLFSVGTHQDIRPEELAEQVVEAMVETNIGDLHLSREKQELFRERLTRLFKIETLVIVAKALNVLMGNENNFCSARILTDIRPVFGSDPGVAPNAAVIVHMLNLSYHHEGEIKEFYVAMDNVDIQSLREALDRAELKTQSLKTVIKTAGVTYLDRQE
jgi:hypothetical protein